MLFFYIRHGDPIYNPDSLTPLGERQAEAIGKRLAMYGVDRIFSSTSERAKKTAKPVCEMLHKELTELEFCHEKLAGKDFMIPTASGRKEWVFQNPDARLLMTEPAVLELGARWYEHPAFEGATFQTGLERVANESDAFFAALGFEHERGTGRYKILFPNRERVALFAHQGFGMLFLSCLLDIPYPRFCNHFDFCHSGMTVIDFQEVGDYAIPRVLSLSSDGHLYKEGVPRHYYPQF